MCVEEGGQAIPITHTRLPPALRRLLSNLRGRREGLVVAERAPGACRGRLTQSDWIPVGMHHMHHMQHMHASLCVFCGAASACSHAILLGAGITRHL